MELDLEARLAALCLLLISPLLGLLFYVRLRKRRAKALLNGRPPLDARVFATQFFGHEPYVADLAGELRTLLQEHLPFDLAGLRPHDRLFDDLWLHQWNHLAPGELLDAVNTRYAVQVDPSVLRPGSTFSDLVEQVSSCVAHRRPTSVSPKPNQLKR